MPGTRDGATRKQDMATENRCKKCNCKCHCNEALHADVYGMCPCPECICKNPKNDGEECLSCQQRSLVMKWIIKLWNLYVEWLFKEHEKDKK